MSGSRDVVENIRTYVSYVTHRPEDTEIKHQSETRNISVRAKFEHCGVFGM